MNGVAGWQVPPQGSDRRHPKTSFYEGNTYIQDVFSAGAEAPRVAVPPCHPRQRTTYFAASTCRKCGHIILAGTTYGLRLDLEPRQLDDQTEVDALADNVPTYNLLPDRTAQRRHLEEIRGPAKHPRHAKHTCGRQYGHHSPPPAPATPSTTDDRPPF